MHAAIVGLVVYNSPLPQVAKFQIDRYVRLVTLLAHGSGHKRTGGHTAIAY